MSQSIDKPNDQLNAKEAAALLGVKLPTLYAYVSRGLLRSLPGDGNARARRYLRTDVEAMRDRNRGTAAAAAALRFGEPVLDSGITEMTDDGPAYRGQPAADLVRRGVSFESVAELLWTGSLVDDPGELATAWAVPAQRPPFSRVVDLLPEQCPPATVRPLVLAAWAARDPGRFDPRPEAVLPRARAATRLLATSLALPADPARAREAWKQGSIAGAVLCAYGIEPSAVAERAISSLLVLMADHELNASTFAARVAASANADVYSSLQAGLATLSGPLHGGASDQVEALLREVDRPEDAEGVVHDRGRRGERLPGFGHAIYGRRGDPRARILVELATELGGDSRELACAQSLLGAVERANKPPPNVDMGAVVLRAALGLPAGAVAGLFAVGRSAGWVAHILEQYEARQLLRPRARYVGPPSGHVDED